MSSVQGVVFAVAMAAVCGAAVIHLALKLQKSLSGPPLPLPSPETQFQAESTPPLSPPRPCIISSGEKKEKEKKKKKKKRVRFAKDVAEPSGNSEEFRNRLKSAGSAAAGNNSAVVVTAARGGMPANRVALYNGMLRDRGLHRLAYSY